MIAARFFCGTLPSRRTYWQPKLTNRRSIRSSSSATIANPKQHAERITGGEWDIVTVTYNVAATPSASAPKDLVDAVAELAAFWFKFDRANAQSIGAGPFNTTMITDRAVPAHVLQRVRKHQQLGGRLVGV